VVEPEAVPKLEPLTLLTIVGAVVLSVAGAALLAVVVASACRFFVVGARVRAVVRRGGTSDR
jgi:hypothetical protein